MDAGCISRLHILWKGFQSLGRHNWRCIEKVNTCGPNQTINVIQENDSQSTVDSQVLRHCRVIEDIINNQPSDFESLNVETCCDQEVSIDSLEAPEIKPGIKLPKSNEEWNTANEYFTSIFLNRKIQLNSLDSTIKYVSDSIDYFKVTCETVCSANQSNEFYSKYKDLTANILKQKLRI